MRFGIVKFSKSITLAVANASGNKDINKCSSIMAIVEFEGLVQLAREINDGSISRPALAGAASDCSVSKFTSCRRLLSGYL